MTYRRGPLRTQPRIVDDCLPGLCEGCSLLLKPVPSLGGPIITDVAPWKKPGWNRYRCGGCGKVWEEGDRPTARVAEEEG